jgi:hypothetical protein
MSLLNDNDKDNGRESKPVWIGRLAFPINNRRDVISPII